MSKKKIKAEVKIDNEKKVDEAENLKMQLARALADYDNLKKRVDTEKQVWFKVAASRVVEKFLSVLDNIENAQKHLSDTGLAIVISEFRKAIDEEGFEEIKVVSGETEFDSESMEVIEVVETSDEKENNKVFEVVMSGWKSKENQSERLMVLRPAKVKVYKLKVEN